MPGCDYMKYRRRTIIILAVMVGLMNLMAFSAMAADMDKLAGEPVDLLVNGKLIAKGEVVVIDENYGIRITAIVSPMDRVNKLQ